MFGWSSANQLTLLWINHFPIVVGSLVLVLVLVLSAFLKVQISFLQ